MTVYWLLQQSADVPEGDDWLSPFEHAVLAKYWAPKRRRDWRLGRWTAKNALVRAGAIGNGAVRAPECARLSIRANEAGVPRVFVDDTDGEWEVSISHSGDFGLAAVARKSATVGCDIETIGRRGQEFVVDWFTEAERALAAETSPEARSSIVTLIWSAKESALKALG
ncbi:MAG: 4'-phosphopantetheinyl transferase family protein, partial [Bacteroidales bacterium]